MSDLSLRLAAAAALNSEQRCQILRDIPGYGSHAMYMLVYDDATKLYTSFSELLGDLFHTFVSRMTENDVFSILLLEKDMITRKLDSRCQTLCTGTLEEKKQRAALAFDIIANIVRDGFEGSRFRIALRSRVAEVMRVRVYPIVMANTDTSLVHYETMRAHATSARRGRGKKRPRPAPVAADNDDDLLLPAFEEEAAEWI